MEPYLAEIRMFGGNFAPQGWATCDGQILSIAENEALYTLVGTTYGGDGVSTFALPDLRGRIPIHMSDNYGLGVKGGSETVLLTSTEMPSHTHIPQVDSNIGNSATPFNQFWSANDYKSFSANARKSCEHERASGRFHWRKSTVRQHDACADCDFHHRIARDLSEPEVVRSLAHRTTSPVPEGEIKPCQIPIWEKSECFHSTLPHKGGRSAMDNSFPSVKIKHYFRYSATRTAAMDGQPLRSPI